MENLNKKPIDLWLVWLLAFGGLVLAFPFYTFLVYGLSFDRYLTADILSVHATISYWLGISAALLPLPGLKSWTKQQRIQAVCLAFMLASYFTHISWELGWLILHEAIADAKYEMWAYPWWAYIDGGDTRYYKPQASFLMLEVLSVSNGCIGLTGLYLLKRSGFNSLPGILLCMATAVFHTFSTWYYFGSEIISGFDSVNMDSFMDYGVKFILLNAPWLVFPWFVLFWGYSLIKSRIDINERQVTD